MGRALEGKVALVTGAGTRLGKAIALGLGRAGADVAVHFHSSSEGAEAAVKEIRIDGNRSETFQADLSSSGAATKLVTDVEARLGRVQILVNSAALFHRVDFLETSDAVLDTQWQVNTRGPYVLTREVVRRMAGAGDVINILDVGGAVHAWKHYSAYCMTKAAMASLTRCLALELAPGIRVNAVAPGTVLPPESLGPEELARVRERIPQQRFGSPEDIVAAVLFLLTGPSFMTGQILAVDGGRSVSSAG